MKTKPKSERLQPNPVINTTIVHAVIQPSKSKRGNAKLLIYLNPKKK